MDGIKNIICETLKDMLKTTELNNIKVKDICKNANISRQTFYYHFKDKYHIVAYIYSMDWYASFKKAGFQIDENQVYYLLLEMKRKSLFYKKVFSFSSMEQNCLFEYVRKNFEQNWLKLFNNSNSQMVDEYFLFALKYHTYGWTCMISEWVQQMNDIDAKNYACKMIKMEPTFLDYKPSIEEGKNWTFEDFIF